MVKTTLEDSDNRKQVIEENENWHDKEAKIYDHVRSELWNFYEQKRIADDIEKIEELSDGKDAVDIGSGTGNLVLKLARTGFSVDAVDVSEEMIEVLREKINGKEPGNVALHNEPAEDFLSNQPGSRDVICFSSVLHHLPDYFGVLENAISALKPGGLIYVVHEPLPEKIDREDGNLSYLDKFLTPRTSFHRWRAPEKDSDMVDYHIDRKDGIDSEKLEEFLREKGMKIAERQGYTTWKSGVLSSFDDILDLTERTDFKLLARKPPS
jgi:ubiquinone/menaquinone biosynthesis C-methylase UbiE